MTNLQAEALYFLSEPISRAPLTTQLAESIDDFLPVFTTEKKAKQFLVSLCQSGIVPWGAQMNICSTKAKQTAMSANLLVTFLCIVIEQGIRVILDPVLGNATLTEIVVDRGVAKIK